MRVNKNEYCPHASILKLSNSGINPYKQSGSLINCEVLEDFWHRGADLFLAGKAKLAVT